ncbi:retrovirus-related Pol polyprotein from transposon 297 [Trichonephila clavipes]|nr:retrovirus-related Pol polyprotein from transposon 297 [Trichonephila clavipes]
MNRRAASHSVPKELSLELFLQQLPTSVQTMLASITPITVEKAAEVANRILVVSTPNVSTNAIASSSENRILQEIERLNKRIDDLTMRQRTPERRNNSRQRNRSRYRSFPRSRESCCWYHKKFQERAKKCIPPCSYKKRIQRGVIATTFSQPHISRRLFIKDKSSNTAFLIDTGSDVSVLPASISEKRKGNSIQQLSAANTSPINVYEIVKPPSFSQEVKHNVKHFIETSGPPVFAKARRLAPDHLKIAKSEFQHMLNLGHIRPSKSNYASPLHIVPKKDSNDWRPVGDNLALNVQTKKEKYSIPNILDFTSELHGKNIFSHIDLVKAYHQIPINEEDIHKTTILTAFGLYESTRMHSAFVMQLLLFNALLMRF